MMSKYLKEENSQDYDILDKEIFTKNRSSSSTGHGNRSGTMAQIDQDMETVKKKSLDPNISQ
jgi:hypothetical protein